MKSNTQYHTNFGIHYRYIPFITAHALASCLSVTPSVCLSVRHTPVLCLNDYTYTQTFYTVEYSHHSKLFCTERYGKIPTDTSPNGGVECKGYEKIVIFDQHLVLSRKRYKTEPYWWPTNSYTVVICGLSNGAIFNDLERPQTQINFQGHADAEYLRNGTKYRHSYNEILIGTYALHKIVILTDYWPWVILSDLAERLVVKFSIAELRFCV